MPSTNHYSSTLTEYEIENIISPLRSVQLRNNISNFYNAQTVEAFQQAMIDSNSDWHSFIMKNIAFIQNPNLPRTGIYDPNIQYIIKPMYYGHRIPAEINLTLPIMQAIPNLNALIQYYIPNSPTFVDPNKDVVVKNLKFIKKLGGGAFGNVELYSSVDDRNNPILVAKKSIQVNLHPNIYKELEREVIMLLSISAVPVYNVYLEKDDYVILMKYIEGIDGLDFFID